MDIVEDRLVQILDSKLQNEKKINELKIQAKILRKRLQIDDSE